MKAVVFRAYGPPNLLRCEEIDKPMPGADEILGDMVRSIGADHVVDYAREDFTQGRERYDLIFDTLKGLIEAKHVTPVIDRSYPLSGVPAAILYLEAGHARGKVSIHL